jgi:transposase-like protein
MVKKTDANFDYNEEVKKCKTIDDVMGKNGLIQRLVKDVLENILEAEMEDHLGRDKYERQNIEGVSERNYRNGLDLCQYFRHKKLNFLCNFSS